MNELGFFYIILGLAIILIAVGLAFSDMDPSSEAIRRAAVSTHLSRGAKDLIPRWAGDIPYLSLIEWCYFTSYGNAVCDGEYDAGTAAGLGVCVSAVPLGPNPSVFKHIAGMCLRICDVCKTESARLCRRHAGQS